MGRIQIFVSQEVESQINAIIEQRRVEGALAKDANISCIGSMLLELGLRVYSAQMERKDSAFNQMEYNKVTLETILKIHYGLCKTLGMLSLSPHLSGMDIFEYKKMRSDILKDVRETMEKYFPSLENEEE